MNDEPVGQMTTVDATAKEAALPDVVSASINADMIPTAAVDGDVTMEQEAGQEISIGEEYDADVSQTQTQVVVELVPKRSARARRASRKAAAALTPIAPETEPVAPSASEALHAAAVVVAEVKDVPAVGAESAPATEVSEDVFGPTSRRIAKAKKGRGKGKKRASSTRPSGDSESGSNTKRIGLGADEQVCRFLRGPRLFRHPLELILRTRSRFRLCSLPLRRACRETEKKRTRKRRRTVSWCTSRRRHFPRRCRRRRLSPPNPYRKRRRRDRSHALVCPPSEKSSTCPRRPIRIARRSRRKFRHCNRNSHRSLTRRRSSYRKQARTTFTPAPHC